MNKTISTSCFLCGSNQKLESHHIDWNHDNNAGGNVIILCQRCHSESHKAGYCSYDDYLKIRNMVMERDPQRFSDSIPNAQLDFFGY